MKTDQLPENYVCNVDVKAFDDTPFADEWQREVYMFASAVADVNDCGTVVDIGCGSGYKLLQYFGFRETIGVESNPDTLAWLKQQYDFNNRLWLNPEEFQTFIQNGWEEGEYSDDVICVCSDVIEHTLDPVRFFESLIHIPWSNLIISTPVRHAHENEGPPGSEYHVCEWSFDEFKAFVSQWDRIKIHLHCIINPEQRTQMIWVKRCEEHESTEGPKTESTPSTDENGNF